MGVVATKAIQVRRRSRIARVDRMIATHDATDPEQVARAARRFLPSVDPQRIGVQTPFAPIWAPRF